jgi:hypothetical protein
MLHRVRIVVLAMLVVGGAACPAYTVLSSGDRELLEKAHGGEVLYLKQSMYVGMFYDDDRYELVHARRFNELTYLQTIEGESIPPPSTGAIIPAGTRVRIERLEWPTGDVVFRRPLYTPRYTTWIWLRVAAERGSDVTIERPKRSVMLLPAGINDAETFNEWFRASLTVEDPNPWLFSLPEEQRLAIEQKRAVPGMTYEALTAALGFPDQIQRGAGGDGTEIVRYGPALVTLVDGVVVGAENAPPAAAAPAPGPNVQPSETPPEAPPEPEAPPIASEPTG